MKNDKGKPVEAPHAIDQWRAIDGRLLFRCPDCNTPVKVTGAGERDSIFCPACGAGLTIPSQALKEVSGAGDLLEIAAEPTPGESGMKGGRPKAPANPASGDESSGDGDEPEPHEVIYTEIRPAPLSVAPSPPDADQSIKPEFPTIDRRPELKRPLDRKRRGGGGHHSSSSDRVRVKKWRKQSPGGHENLFDEPVHQHQAPKRSSRFVYIAAAVFLLVVALVIALTAMPRKNKETPDEEGVLGSAWWSVQLACAVLFCLVCCRETIASALWLSKGLSRVR